MIPPYSFTDIFYVNSSKIKLTKYKINEGNVYTVNLQIHEYFIDNLRVNEDQFS